MTDTMKSQVAAALVEALGDALDCTRAWSAWSVGAMSADDFAPVTGDPDRLDEIAEAALAPMRTAIEASQTEIASLKQSLAEAEGQIRHLEQAKDDFEDALHKIVQWSEAYPLDIFPEPDFKRAHELLKAGGMTLDAISASAMRRVVEGVGKIARDALAKAETSNG